MSDKRPIADFRFGLEWEPKLAEIMTRFPWQDSDFSMADPAKICKKCGRAPGSVNHTSGVAVGFHDFEPSPPFSEEQIFAAREEWHRRMAGLPTKEALSAWHAIHAIEHSKLLALLMACKVKTRDDVELLGCTGCAAKGLTVGDTEFLRIGLAGSGVGLPCFVPADRYCYAHGVSGGLQDGQEQRYAERVESISRPLNAAETGHSKLVTAARRARTEHDTHSLLHGHELPKGWVEQETDNVDDGEAQQDRLSADIIAAGKLSDVNFERVAEAFARPWKCDVHEKTDWTCRHCVAQAVVEGELTPTFRIAGPMGVGIVVAADIDAKIAELSSGSIDHVEIFVQAAAFTRKLARD